MGKTSAEIGADISTAQSRLASMRAVVESLVRQVEAAEAKQRGGDPREAALAAQQLRSLAQQKIDAQELLNEAELRAKEASEAFGKATDDAIRDLGRIEQACSAAAVKFDQGLRSAAAALDELEAAGDKLTRTLLPGEFRSRIGSQLIWLACRLAFRERLSRGEQAMERKSMADSVAHIISDARQNVALLRKQKEREAA